MGGGAPWATKEVRIKKLEIQLSERVLVPETQAPLPHTHTKAIGSIPSKEETNKQN